MFNNKLYELIQKFAVLSDKQYKLILRNPQALLLLDQSDKLDEFYKSMPDTPLQDVADRIKGIKSVKEKEGTDKELPGEVSVFLEEYPNLLIQTKVLNQINSKIIKEIGEAYTEEEGDRLRRYISNNELTVSDFANDYLKSAFYDDEKLKKFITYMQMYLSLEGSESEEAKDLQAKVTSVMTSIVITMIKSIFTTEAVEDETLSTLVEAYKLRKSDYFDYFNYIEDIKNIPKERDYGYPEEVDESDFIRDNSGDVTRSEVPVPKNEEVTK